MSNYKHEYGLIVYYIIFIVLVLILCSLALYLCFRKCRHAKVSSTDNGQQNKQDKSSDDGNHKNIVEDIRSEVVNTNIKNPYEISCISSQVNSINGNTQYSYTEYQIPNFQPQIYSVNENNVYPEVQPQIISNPITQNPYIDRE